MDAAEIKDVVLGALSTTNLGRPEDDQLVVSDDAVIFGPGSPLDSLALVALLIDIEEAMAIKGCPVTLSDERAMSQTRSPFRSVPRLVEYLSTLVRGPE
jgi:acyl carrier protein